MTILGFVGAIASYLLDKSRERSQERQQRELEREQERRTRELDFLERQLRDLYGPLYAIVSTSGIMYDAIRVEATRVLGLPEGIHAKPHSTSEPGKFSIWAFWTACDGKRAPPALVELHRQWAMAINAPQWEEIERRVRENGDLVAEEAFPDAFKQMLVHTSSWKLLIATWTNKSPHEHAAECQQDRNFVVHRYPAEFAENILRTYANLKRRQMELLAQLKPAS